MSRPVGAWRIFRWPLVIGLVSSAGLVAALLVEGVADLPWTLAIAVPLVVIAGAFAKQRRP